MNRRANTPRVVVVGAGPAGLMAAGTAAGHGADVLLLEKNAGCGQKLLLTGAGRCNITNHASWDDFLDRFAVNRKFLIPAFRHFFVEDLLEFFSTLNLSFVLEKNGKYFPQTQRATSVRDALLAYCQKQLVEIHEAEAAEDLKRQIGQWSIRTRHRTYTADAVILATGGLSYPKTGSDGAGHRLAAKLGHQVISCRPGLVPLVISQPDCARLSGISLNDVAVTLRDNKAAGSSGKISRRRGSLLFTHFGVSGPVVLTLSRWLPPDYDQPSQANSYELVIDLFPGLPRAEVEEQLLKACRRVPKRLLRTILSRDLTLPQTFASWLIELCGLKPDMAGQHLSLDGSRRMTAALKALRLPIAGTRGYEEAMITAGGISTREIDPRTMASKRYPGLYFAGEIIDVDADTGGFNLQVAFSTGYLAGRSAADYNVKHN